MQEAYLPLPSHGGVEEKQNKGELFTMTPKRGCVGRE